MVYDGRYPQANGLKLNTMKLTAVPDLCTLLKPEDHSQVRNLDLSNNLIRVVNQDLTCLTNLKILNLSYNQIEVVSDLGDLPNLVDLKLQKNKLAETNNLPDFPALKSLNL
jgi:Leucine-rich repeat (LRR) protein